MREQPRARRSAIQPRTPPIAIVISTESGRYMPIPTVRAGKVRTRRFSQVSAATSTGFSLNSCQPQAS